MVDRIVSGFPQDAIVKEHLFNMIGKEDRLLSVGEPFGLWVIENKGNLKSLIREGEHNIRVVLADSIDYYKKRKVRVLNGSHTNMVALGLMLGQQTVYDCITNPGINAFFKASLEEIIPFVDENVQDTRAFAADVEERFLNPFLNHQLLSIALNSISKWKSRVLPTFKAYYQANKNIPPMLTIGFSYLMALYSTRCYDLKDEQAILHYFRQGNSIEGFMAKADVWGEDLTQYPGFAETVSVQVKAILAGEKLYENR